MRTTILLALAVVMAISTHADAADETESDVFVCEFHEQADAQRTQDFWNGFIMGLYWSNMRGLDEFISTDSTPQFRQFLLETQWDLGALARPAGTELLESVRKLCANPETRKGWPFFRAMMSFWRKQAGVGPGGLGPWEDPD